MADVEPFGTFGVGNGFPACFGKQDVSSLTHWSTLGGYKKTDVGDPPTDAEITLSLINAMKVFWVLKGCNGMAFASTSDTTVSVSSGGVGDSTYESPDPAGPPVSRSCFPTNQWNAEKSDSVIRGTGPNQTTSATIGVASDEVVKMYNGSESDETKFVGYGIRSVAHVVAYDSWVFSDPLHAKVQLGSFSFESPYSASYTTIAGIPLICFLSGPSDSGPDETTTYGNRSVEYTASGLSLQARLDSLDFYTFSLP